VNVVYRELAISDVERISQYLTERSPTGARNVMRAIHAAITDISESPVAAPKTSDPTVHIKVVDATDTRSFTALGRM
jgi:plasmid stabilization system protein ParE